MMHWCVWDGAPVRVEPGRGLKLTILQKYMRVDVLESATALYNNIPTLFHHVKVNEDVNGWVYAGYLELYHGNSARTSIKNPTANPHDAEQYLVWNGGTQFNLCGFFCIARAIGWEADIEDMLDLLKEAKPQYVGTLFNSSNRGLTGVDDLVNIITMLGREDPPRLADMLKDRVTGIAMLTPGRMAQILDSYRVIFMVHINKRSGRVARTGIGHWVMLEDINLMDYGGIVEVYNPFGDRWEAYEWDQLIESAGHAAGVLVPR